MRVASAFGFHEDLDIGNTVENSNRRAAFRDESRHIAAFVQHETVGDDRSKVFNIDYPICRPSVNHRWYAPARHGMPGRSL
jgi:hypothetical protein